jgi:hypothetical protein
MQLPEGLCSGISARDKNLHAPATRQSLVHAATEEGLYKHKCMHTYLRTNKHAYIRISVNVNGCERRERDASKRSRQAIKTDEDKCVFFSGRRGYSLLVLVLEGQRKPVDDRPEDFKQLSHAVVALSVINEAVEDVADRLTDEGAVWHELACVRGHSHM